MRFGFFYAAIVTISLSFGACVTDWSTDSGEQESGANTDNGNTPDDNSPDQNTPDPNAPGPNAPGPNAPGQTGQNGQNASNYQCSNTSDVCYCNANTDCAEGFVCQIADSPPPPFQGICFPAPKCNSGTCP